MPDIPDLVNKIKENNDEKALQELIELTKKLVYKIYHSYGPALVGCGIILEDLFSEIPCLIYNACLKYSPARFKRKSKFTTYLASFARWECLNLINANKNHDRIDSEEVINILNKRSKENYFGGDSVKITKENASFVLSILDSLDDKRVKRICQLRFFTKSGKPLAWRKIGPRIGHGLSGQAICNIWKKNVKLLKAKLESQSF